MTMSETPPALAVPAAEALTEPLPQPPLADWEHFALYEKVKDALSATPAFFRSDVTIAGVPATDLQNLNTLLGASIEERVVDALNVMRPVWDPDLKYQEFSFVRQPQTFPDVLLRHQASGAVLLGIELKGWYLLAKEEEPSFRFTVTHSACAAADLLVVFPWHLSEVISGTPRLLQPYVNLAKFVAKYRNFQWARKEEHGEIVSPAGVNPYPVKSDAISDRAARDGGGNFGRIARTGLLNDYMAQVDARLLSGIPANKWRAFLKAFQQGADADKIERAMAKLVQDVARTTHADAAATDALTLKLRKIAEILAE